MPSERNKSCIPGQFDHASQQQPIEFEPTDSHCSYVASVGFKGQVSSRGRQQLTLFAGMCIHLHLNSWDASFRLDRDKILAQPCCGSYIIL